MSAHHDSLPGPPTRWTSLVTELRQDRAHGASWLARRAADMLASCAREALTQAGVEREGALAGPGSNAFNELDDMAALAWALAWVRPSMAAIANTVTAIWRCALVATAEDAANDAVATIERLRIEAERQREGWARVAAELAQHIRPLLRGPVFTLSRSGSVEHALIAVARSRTTDAPLEIIIAESRPGGEGIALAEALAGAGALVSVVPDSAVGVAMARAGTLLLGADSVRGDGALVNKVGSYPAALVAADLKIPVYALCERLKITPVSYPPILEREADEDGTSRASGEWMRESWLFDLTPARLITAFITEDGALPLAEIAHIASQGEEALAALRSSVERERSQHSRPG